MGNEINEIKDFFLKNLRHRQRIVPFPHEFLGRKPSEFPRGPRQLARDLVLEKAKLTKEMEDAKENRIVNGKFYGWEKWPFTYDSVETARDRRIYNKKIRKIKKIDKKLNELGKEKEKIMPMDY